MKETGGSKELRNDIAGTKVKGSRAHALATDLVQDVGEISGFISFLIVNELSSRIFSLHVIFDFTK